MMENRKFLVALTGGGTAGHVMPHLALLNDFAQAGMEVFYIGSAGIEKNLAQQANIPFEEIAAGKLRRYFSFENLKDVFKVGLGIFQAYRILARRRPQVIFSKGGFVSVPVAIAGFLLRIPVVSHESDLTPGLANRIIAKFAERILYSFPETQKYLRGIKSEYVGLPIREELKRGNRATGLNLCGFENSEGHPVMLVMGGSLGAQRLNQILEKVLSRLVSSYYVIHITGKGKTLGFSHRKYKAFEYVGADLKHVFAATDLVISRAGANSVFEFLALGIPMLLVPLEIGSRGDQVQNAEYFSSKNWARVMMESKMDETTFLEAINKLETDAEKIRKSQQSFDSAQVRLHIIQQLELVMQR